MTSLARWDPFEELAGVWPREFLGRDWFRQLRADGGMAVEWRPRCDVTEADDAIVVHAELPGVEYHDVEVSIDKGVLIIRGEKRTVKEEKEKGKAYSERFFGSFERHLQLPPGTDEASITASMKAGGLEGRVPRTGSAVPEAKKIEVTPA